MSDIKNIRFTNQCPYRIYLATAPESGGSEETALPKPTSALEKWRTAMTTQFNEFASSRPGFAGQVRALFGRIARNSMTAVIAWSNRRSAGRYLSGMDDRMLSDIGLTRSDVRSAWSEPLWRDPTARLKLIAVERRAAFQAMARERHQRRQQQPLPRPPVSEIEYRRSQRPAKRPCPPLVECGEAA
jgi:uncharacterized protein YjiS (DUF1127 family)